MAPLLPVLHKMLGHAASLTAGLGIFATVDFSGSITLGSILIAVVIAAMAGFYTVRSKIANIWRQEAEGERAVKERLQRELTAEKVERLAFEREQQELRHDLKDELAACKAQLKVMEAKTDLTSALDTIQTMNEQTVTAISTAVVDAMHKTSALSEKRDGDTHRLLEEIRDKLPSEPIAVHEIEPSD